ncbi:hypothetical protein ILUMI_16895 [Ignelater luminosus]|uniref:Uncharacterized protein n=1 Tax=Ignelater luminosus TaxID=2038154 RepID=A0A8K0CRG0_IGNLU|nr:hypothetical protein ILUMI_16895 [Ignelater luminosus]
MEILKTGGKDNNDEEKLFQNKVTPKSDEHRYADSLVVSTRKMQAMSLIARCVIYNSNKQRGRISEQSEYEIELMRKIVSYFFGKHSIPDRNIISFES